MKNLIKNCIFLVILAMISCKSHQEVFDTSHLNLELSYKKKLKQYVDANLKVFNSSIALKSNILVENDLTGRSVIIFKSEKKEKIVSKHYYAKYGNKYNPIYILEHERDYNNEGDIKYECKYHKGYLHSKELFYVKDNKKIVKNFLFDLDKKITSVNSEIDHLSYQIEQLTFNQKDILEKSVLSTRDSLNILTVRVDDYVANTEEKYTFNKEGEKIKL